MNHIDGLLSVTLPLDTVVNTACIHIFDSMFTFTEFQSIMTLIP